MSANQQAGQLRLTDKIKTLVNSALVSAKPLSFVYVDDNGHPNISFRGSVLAHSDTQLALWIRNPEAGLVKAIGRNPHVALLYGDLTSPAKSFITFRGNARIDGSDAVRRAVYEGSPEAERNLDKDRKGMALIIDLETVHGMAAGERFQMAK